ncbi:hypothetical protein [Streptacidiphilus anmyonensis]|uniref:hypothetical protein n=1 Tax=Streptacidiphilus anmyonensis TaxID=405782 RepID=UPI0005A995B5|nr:hypothetical protein [Streptacidiphilus anmyonensis]
MPSPDHGSLPDIAVGRHPDYGIVAANPQQLAAGAWILKGLDFHPIHEHPTLHALANQQQDGPGRATRAVALLRGAGYQVAVDLAFNPAPAPFEPVPACDRLAQNEPDVAFAEHPQLGIVAATADTINAVERGGAILESHGWLFNHALDIYTLPITTGRSEALGKVAAATVSMHQSDLQVAVQPRLAQDVTARRPAAASTANHDKSADLTTRRFPRIAAALASSPARASLPGRAPVAAPTTSTPTARPADPPVAFSRKR